MITVGTTVIVKSIRVVRRYTPVGALVKYVVILVTGLPCVIRFLFADTSIHWSFTIGVVDAHKLLMRLPK